MKKRPAAPFSRFTSRPSGRSPGRSPRPQPRSLASPLWVAAVLVSILGSSSATAQAPLGEVNSLQFLAEGSGGFLGSIDPGDDLGVSVAALGDINGDGIDDMALGADGDDDGGKDRGAVYVLFMAANGTVSSTTKISNTTGGFGAALSNNDGIGRSLAGLGDLNGDGVPDLAVGSSGDGSGGNNRGAAWILFLNSDGSVASHVKITEGSGGFTGTLQSNDGFGRSLANLGDLNGDGITDLAVGADRDSDQTLAQGAVWLLFMKADGTVDSQRKLTGTDLGGALSSKDGFGSAVASLGDFDGNGTSDLAVGAAGDSDGNDSGTGRGAVWILELDAQGAVLTHSKISETAGGFSGSLDAGDEFGSALALLDDLNQDGVRELAVGAPGDDDVSPNNAPQPDHGAAYILFLAADGTVNDHTKISETSGKLGIEFSNDAAFGSSLAAVDLDGNGFLELSAGVPGSSGGGASTVLFLVTPAGDDGNQPYEGAVTTLTGRPGRPTLVVVPPDASLPPPPDFIGTPIIIVPKSDGDLVRAQGVDGDASSGFSEGASYPTEESPAQAGAGNFDSVSGGFLGGGLTALSDVVTANTDSDSVSVLIGLPDGTFAPAVNTALAADTQPIAIQVGDFDGDQKDDVAVAGADGVTVMLGDGMASFTTQTFVPVADLTDLDLAFVNDDAFLDVVTTSGTLAVGSGQESGFATVLLGNGDGSLAEVSSFSPGQALASVLLGELNQDGNVDALITTHQFDGGPNGEPQGVIELFLGDGNGSFSLSPVFTGFMTPDVGGVHPTYGSLADLTGDGRLDALYTSTSSLAYPLTAFANQHPPVVLTLLEADGAGGFNVSELGTAYSGKGVTPVIEDYSLPTDQVPDAVLVWHEDVLAGTGSATEENQTFLALLSGNGMASIFDDITANQFATGDEPGDGVLADIDGIGQDSVSTLDIAVPNRADNSLTILLGQGDGSFVAAPVVTNVDDTVSPGPTWVGGPRVVYFGGKTVVNGSVFGFPLVAYNAWEDTGPGADPTVLASLSLFSGGVSGQLVKAQQLMLPKGGDFAQLDLDDDAVSDIVVTQFLGAPSGSDSIHVYMGLGPASGMVDTQPVVVPVPAGFQLTGGLHLANFLGSALPDLVTSAVDTASQEGFVIVFENSAGSFLPGLAWPMGDTWSRIRGLDVGDLNGNGLFDIALGEADGRLYLARGQADGSFLPAPPAPILGNIAGGALELAEITGDGVLDLISASDLGQTGLGQAYVRTARGSATGLHSLQTVGGLASIDADGKALRPLVGDVDGDGSAELVLIHGLSDSLSIFPNAFHTFESYGLSKPGAGGITPTLEGKGYTILGGTPKFVISQGVGGAPSLVQFGLGRTPLLFPAVGMVINQFILPLSGTPGAPGAGNFSITVTMPADPAFLGIEFTLQAIILDGAAGAPEPWGFSITEGLAFTLVE